MLAFLGERADTVVVDRFEATTTTGEALGLANILAGFQPDSARRILLLTHWDTRPRADQSTHPEEREKPVPGANDGASGTAVLMELANLMASTAPPVGVDLLFVDGEDFGPTTADMFLGSKRFASKVDEGAAPEYAILLDMVGDEDPLFPVEGYSAEFAPQVVQKVWGAARSLGFGGLFPERIGPSIVDDHLPLNEAGIPTANVIDFEYGPDNRLWHTPDDLPENTSSETLRIVGEVVAELIYRGG